MWVELLFLRAKLIENEKFYAVACGNINESVQDEVRDKLKNTENEGQSS